MCLFGSALELINKTPRSIRLEIGFFSLSIRSCFVPIKYPHSFIRLFVGPQFFRGWSSRATLLGAFCVSGQWCLFPECLLWLPIILVPSSVCSVSSGQRQGTPFNTCSECSGCFCFSCVSQCNKWWLSSVVGLRTDDEDIIFIVPAKWNGQGLLRQKLMSFHVHHSKYY